jgi:carbon-monoxide dehydrogenase medium subunit/6-hydroxypseudooxynicotine dehydrogenase subunit alpha
LVEVEVPPPPAGSRSAFVEHARTHGDFALGGAAAIVGAGEARIALLAAGPAPIRAREAEALVVAGAGAADAAEAAVAGLELTGDDADWRRALLRELVRRAIEAAA